MTIEQCGAATTSASKVFAALTPNSGTCGPAPPTGSLVQPPFPASFAKSHESTNPSGGLCGGLPGPEVSAKVRFSRGAILVAWAEAHSLLLVALGRASQAIMDRRPDALRLRRGFDDDLLKVHRVGLAQGTV